MKYKYYLLLALFSISLISSAIMAFTPVEEICDPGVGCDIVQHSSYAKTFGIKNSYYGLGIFSFLVLVTLLQLKKPTKQKKQIINLAIIVGSVIAIYFISLQHFILNAYCKYCLIVDFSLLAALTLIIIDWKN